MKKALAAVAIVAVSAVAWVSFKAASSSWESENGRPAATVSASPPARLVTANGPARDIALDRLRGPDKAAGEHDCRADAMEVLPAPPRPEMRGDLEKALQDGDPRDVERLLAQGATDPTGLDAATAGKLKAQRLANSLYPAAMTGDVAQIRDLLARGAPADPLEGHLERLTPLAWAASCNQVGAVSALLDGGADPNRRFRYSAGVTGWSSDSTALIWASRSNAVEAASVLLRRGADPTVRERYFWTEVSETSALDEARTPEMRAMLTAAIEGRRTKAS